MKPLHDMDDVHVITKSKFHTQNTKHTQLRVLIVLQYYRATTGYLAIASYELILATLPAIYV